RSVISNLPLRIECQRACLESLARRRANPCKKLTTRRLLARRPSGRLSQSALRGGALSAEPFSSRRKKRAAVSVAREAALQLMRQSLGARGDSVRAGVRVRKQNARGFGRRESTRTINYANQTARFRIVWRGGRILCRRGTYTAWFHRFHYSSKYSRS